MIGHTLSHGELLRYILKNEKVKKGESGTPRLE